MDELIEKAIQKLEYEFANLPEDVLKVFHKRYERNISSARLDAHHTIHNALLGSGHTSSCYTTDIFIVSGRDIVNNAGRVTLKMPFCGLDVPDRFPLVLVREPDFVATPHGSTPAFITTNINSTSQQVTGPEFLQARGGGAKLGGTMLTSLSIDVMAWRGDGSPAPSIPFSWICTIEAMELGNIGAGFRRLPVVIFCECRRLIPACRLRCRRIDG